MKPVTELMAALIGSLEDLGSRAGDSDEERLSKAILTFAATIIGGLAVVWGLFYMALGRPVSALIPMSYAAVSFMTIFVFAITKRYRFFRFSQLLLILVLPFMLQWSLGGYAQAGVVMIWGVLCPLGALMFTGRVHANRWLMAYVVLAIASGGAEGLLKARIMPVSPAANAIFFVMNMVAASVTIYFLFHYFVRERERAKAQSDRLLLNVLPAAIAQRLKANPGIIADMFEDASVLFADLVDFTSLASKMRPQELVVLLNQVFSAFDRLSEKYGVEKIKTIGDAYMAVGGVPNPRPDHLVAMVDMALEMAAAVQRLTTPSGQRLRLRVGVGVGAVVAGVIGEARFAYDLWGDTVNTASRMEAHGVENAVQVTEQVYQRLKDRYRFEPRGRIDIKGKGMMNTYVVLGRLPK